MDEQNTIERCDYIHAHEDIIAKVNETMPDEEILYDLAELFKIFGDSTRIKILYVLFEAEMCVCDIAQRGSEISFTFAGADAVPVNAVMALCSLPKNRRRLTLSATGTEPKLLLRLTPNEDALDTALTLVGDLRVNKEENEKEVTL